MTWDEELANPPAFGSEKHKELIRRSSNWCDCAVGEVCPDASKAFNGLPHDNTLYLNGVEFGGAIVRGEWDNAKLYLKAIRNRYSVMQGTSKLVNEK